MRIIPDAKSKGIMLDKKDIEQAILRGCNRELKRFKDLKLAFDSLKKSC